MSKSRIHIFSAANFMFMANLDPYSAFEKTSKEFWLNQIKSEIGELDFDSLQIEIDPDWSVSPFIHSEDIQISSNINRIKDGLKWQIQEAFGHSLEDQSVMMASLQGGCESILFSISDETQTGLNELLKEVFVEMIPIHLESETLSVLELLQQQFSDLIKEKKFNPLKISGSIRCINPHKNEVQESQLLKHVARNQFARNLKSICWAMPCSDSDQGITHSISSFFKELTSYLEIIKSEDDRILVLKNSILQVKIGSHYFKEIIRLRAIRLLWRNLLNAHGLDGKDILLEIHFCPQAYAEEPEKNMIRGATMTLAAIQGGADVLYILPADSDPASKHVQYRRIARNIHHLLRQESYIEKHADPIRGSYFFEAVVQQIVEKVWAQCLK